jgi:hypothetical protein
VQHLAIIRVEQAGAARPLSGQAAPRQVRTQLAANCKANSFAFDQLASKAA